MNPNPTFALILLTFAMLAGCTSDSAQGLATHLAVDYGAGGPVPVAAVIGLDPAGRPAQALYDTNHATHPAFYSALDQLEQWAHDSGHSVEATYSQGFGDFFIAHIDNLPATGSSSYWSLSVNGTASEIGVGQVALHGGERISWALTAYTPPATTGSSASLTMTLPAKATTAGETLLLNGTVSASATITFLPASLKIPSLQATGAWQAKIPLAYGRTSVRVVASNDQSTAAQNVTLVRLAPIEVKVNYNMAPGHTARDDKLMLDLGDFSSASAYTGKDLAHPDFATAHDAMVAWTNTTKVQVSYEYSKGLGFSVSQIDGIGSPLAGAPVQPWCYNYNGASASLGISSQPIKAGDVIEWVLGCA